MRWVTVALLLTACIPRIGSPEAQSPSPEDTAAEEAAEEEAEAAAAHAACEAALEDFLDELNELNSRLGVGVQFSAYLELVGDARVEYDQVDFGDLDQTCLGDVGVPAERALRLYIKAGNIWNRCIQDFGCDIDSIDPQLQERWADAGTAVNSAENGLADMLP
jgi:hypothetical protein